LATIWDRDQLLTALRVCKRFETLDFPGAALIKVDEFLFTGQLYAAIDQHQEQNRAYVAFRGSVLNNIGNWILTDFQAASTRFRLFDDEIGGDNCLSIPVQGGFQKEILPGRVHQGFFRGTCRLWYGDDWTSNLADDADNPRRRRMRHGLSFALVFAIALAAGTSIGHAVAYGLLVSLSFAAVETGFVERLFRREPPKRQFAQPASLASPESDRLRQRRFDLAQFDEVFFVGHSLGGAMATLAFAIYAAWCRSTGLKDNARLITFGAPRVGDENFVAAFEGRHAGQHIHIESVADPFPEVPPATVAVTSERVRRKRGVLAAMFVPMAVVWSLLYRVLWDQPAYASWPEGAEETISGGRVCFLAHVTNAYLALLDAPRR
jgi:pimeloyl-ACP methyl ester carboxylesterase